MIVIIVCVFWFYMLCCFGRIVVDIFLRILYMKLKYMDSDYDYLNDVFDMDINDKSMYDYV